MTAARKIVLALWVAAVGTTVGMFVVGPSACTKRTAPWAPPAIPTPIGTTTSPPATSTPAEDSGTASADASVIAPAKASAACGSPAASPRGTSYKTLDGRTFHVWGPAAYDAKKPYPVVLTFHGWKTNGRDFQTWFKMEDHVEGAAFVVYPDSKGPLWDLTGDSDLVFTADIIEAVSKAYCIDRSRVFALGFSYGAKLVHHLGCKRGDLVRGISGGDGSARVESGCKRLPVLVTHRTRDPDERIEWGRDSAKQWAKANGCSDATDETDAAHGCAAYRGCAAGAGVTFCEDRHFDKTWPNDWNHTIREEYRDLTWSWFKSLP